MNRVKQWACLMVFCIPFNALAWDGFDRRQALVGKQLVLNAKGIATAYGCEIPQTEFGSTTALCFDVPLFNLKTGRYVGVMTDALSDVTTDDTFPGALKAVATSTFHFIEWFGAPSLTTRVVGSVQPFVDNNPLMTHMTGYVPTPGGNDIIDGSGRFAFAEGTARESGSVNLAAFTGQVGDEVQYDLLWVITLR